LLRQTG